MWKKFCSNDPESNKPSKTQLWYLMTPQPPPPKGFYVYVSFVTDKENNAAEHVEEFFTGPRTTGRGGQQ